MNFCKDCKWARRDTAFLGGKQWEYAKCLNPSMQIKGDYFIAGIQGLFCATARLKNFPDCPGFEQRPEPQEPWWKF